MDPTSPSHASSSSGPIAREQTAIHAPAGASNLAHDVDAGIRSNEEAGAEPMSQSGRSDHYLLDRLRVERPRPSKGKLKAMIATMFMVMFIAGWNDASQGPLLPLLQEYYQVRYVIISMIWIAVAVGVMISAFSNVWMTDHLGCGITTAVGAAIQGSAYALMCWGAPYPVFVIAYVFIGIGLGWLDAQINSMASRVPNATVIMNVVHAVYGFGATVSPFVSTAFIQRLPERFYLYFLVSLGLGAATLALVIVVFRGYTEDQLLGKRERKVVDDGVPVGQETHELTKLEEDGSTKSVTGFVQDKSGHPIGGSGELGSSHADKELRSVPVEPALRDSGTKLRTILTTPKAYYLAFYIFLYMGIEITIGGWATTFLITERGGDSNAGYVSAGYFGGLTVGRIILIPVTKRLGHRLSVYVYTCLCIVLEILVLTVRSLYANATFFAIVGVFLGPMYPSVMLVVSEIMDPDLVTGVIGLVACVGVVGSAIMPFITGALSDRYGVWVLQPLMIALLVLSMGLWTLVARAKKLST